MSTIACPRCGSAFPLAQVAKYEQFTCGACGTIVPVPTAPPVVVPTVRPLPAAPAPAQQTRPIPQASQPARPAPTRPATSRSEPSRPPGSVPAPAPVPATRPAIRAVPARPAAPAAAPAPAQAARRAPPPPPPPPVEEDEEVGSGRRGRRGGERAGRNPMPLVLSAVGAVVILVGAIVLLNSGGGDEPAGGASVAATGGSGGGGPVATIATDPEKDPAAWKALPEADRRTRALMKASNVDHRAPGSARSAYDFLIARDEKEIADGIAREALKATPDALWAHSALGHEDLRELYDKCVKECPLADFNSAASMQELQRLRRTTAPKDGPWWGDEDTRKTVLALVEQVRAEEKTLSTPFGQAVAKWVAYHRSIEVMRDYPAIHGTVGPYLVFVSLPVAEELRGKATIADVKPEDLKHGQEILERTLALYGEFYEAFQKEIGARMGFTRHGPENTDQEKILLVNVFTSAEDYYRYVARTGGPMGARAYYSLQEPRFITTYDGKRAPPPPKPGEKPKPVEEDPFEDAEQVQCHEGTHQLVHFHTWETSCKALGRRLEWLDCRASGLWFTEGFAEFMAAYKKAGDRHEFMAPLEERMADLWTIGEVIREKGWEDWRLREVLDPLHSGQLQTYALSRVRKPGEESLAANAMINLYYAKAWSLVYFLWNHESGGAPKYRAAFENLMKRQFSVEQRQTSDGRWTTVLVDAKAFRKTFGIEDQAAFDAFEKEWKEWEAKFVQASKTPEWDKRRAFLRKVWELDK